MANPSTTGTGTEVPRRFYYDATGSSVRSILTVAANHIYLVKTIIIHDRSDVATSAFDLEIDYDGGGTAIKIINDQTIGTKGTFVSNDVFALTAGDILKLTASHDTDVLGFYIDQDWS